LRGSIELASAIVIAIQAGAASACALKRPAGFDLNQKNLPAAGTPKWRGVISIIAR
jgi:hypothetical protein